MSTNLPSTTAATSRPAFLSSQEAVGLDGLDRVVAPPNLVIVQSMSDKLLEAGYKAGEVVMQPAQEPVPETLTVVPVFYFTEYVVLNPREAKELPMIRERSLDHTSDIAQKCRELAEFDCPEMPGKRCKYQANMVFIVFVEELQQLITLRFYRAEYKTGRLFASKIKARNASIFAGRYVIQVGVHKNETGRWHGWDFKACDRPWVTEEEYTAFSTMYQRCNDAYQADALRTDVDDRDGDDDANSDGRF